MAKKNRFYFDKLPKDLQNEINEKYLSEEDKLNLSLHFLWTSKTTFNETRKASLDEYNDNAWVKQKFDVTMQGYPEFFNPHLCFNNPALRKAAKCILLGNMEESLKIIDKHPQILKMAISRVDDREVTLRDGKKVTRFYTNTTLYRLALGCDPELAKEIANRLDQLDKSGTLRAEQYDAQFPKGVKSKKSYRKLFANFIDAIKSDQTIDITDKKNIMSEGTQNELHQLQDQLTLSLTGEHKSGMHVDAQLIIDLVDIYNEKHNDFQTWQQRYFYWRCVFGWIEKFMNSYTAMAMSEQNGLLGLLKTGNSVTRSTTLNDKSDFFSPGLGEIHFVEHGEWMQVCRMGCDRDWKSLKEFMSQQQQKLESLSSQSELIETSKPKM